jgi:hypothetical protein
VIDLVPRSPTEFVMRYTAGKLTFDVKQDEVKGFTLDLGGATYPIARTKAQ